MPNPPGKLINKAITVGGIILVFFLAACAQATEIPPPAVTVTYAGISGYLISVGEVKVLIDAPTPGALPGTVHAAAQAQIVAAAPPFDHLDLILATHDHGDHFDAPAMRQVLEKNPEAVFISTSQAASQLEKYQSRVLTADPREGTPVNLEVHGIQIEAVYLSHGTPSNPADEVYNNGYVITLDGVTIFHSGDIGSLEVMTPYDLPAKGIDLAFIPHFYMREDAAVRYLADQVAAHYYIPSHLQGTTPGFNADILAHYFPEAVVLEHPLDSWSMP